MGVPQLLAATLNDRRSEVIVACLEGCGTAIINDSELILRIGDRITGSDKTQPDQETIDAVGQDNILDPEIAKVDNVEGVCVAYDNGVHSVTVTTGSVSEAQMMRDMFGSDLCIIGIFKELPESDAERARELMDILSVGSETEFVTPFGEKMCG